MELDVFRRLLPAFSAGKLIYLQGWGEPLLHPDFWEMARQAARTGARVGFTTGGTELEETNRRALLESPVEILGVSLAGATPGTHDRFRPGSPLEVLDRNLRALRSKVSAGASHSPALHLAWILLADNLEELSAAVDLARRWGADQLVVSQLSLVLDREMEEQSLLVRHDLWPRAREVLCHVRARARQAGLRFHVHGFGDSPPGKEAGDLDSSSQAHRAAGSLPACSENVLRSCFVSTAGNVSPCVMTNLGLRSGAEARYRFQGKSFPAEALVFGSLKDASLDEIWQGSKARDFRRVFRRRIWEGTVGREGLPEPCRTCWKLMMV
jgi:MoaA/NifB/PqqE/SkfB family radical SAM enzyme